MLPISNVVGKPNCASTAVFAAATCSVVGVLPLALLLAILLTNVVSGLTTLEPAGAL